jgi:hypothetical protein
MTIILQFYIRINTNNLVCSLFPWENGIWSGERLFYIGIVNISQLDEKKVVRKDVRFYLSLLFTFILILNYRKVIIKGF